jgi:hypothetical protein
MTHDWLAVALVPAVVVVTVPLGTKQVDWHAAADALQFIMQVVVVEVCAKRILSPADARPTKPVIAIPASSSANPRMNPPTGQSSSDNIAR